MGGDVTCPSFKTKSRIVHTSNKRRETTAERQKKDSETISAMLCNVIYISQYARARLCVVITILHSMTWSLIGLGGSVCKSNALFVRVEYAVESLADGRKS